MFWLEENLILMTDLAKSVQVVWRSSFQNDLFQNPYFNIFHKTDVGSDSHFEMHKVSKSKWYPKLRHMFLATENLSFKVAIFLPFQVKSFLSC